MRDAVPSLRELDVSDNLIATWGFAVSVCNALHNLELLNLADNRIMLEAPAASPWPQLQLRTLILNRCNITWQHVGACGQTLRPGDLAAVMQGMHSINVRQRTC